MNRITLALMIAASSATAVAAHDDTRLHQIADFFATANVVSGPEVVDCTLSGGTESKCFSITILPNPQSYTPGPWCPTNIADGADKGGIWLKDGEVHDVDGAFIANLATTYGDSKWQLFDKDTGNVRYTGTLEACEAAARPDVDPEYQNHCVQCLPEYLPDDAAITYVIPMEPVASKRETPTNQTGSGLAFNGIRLDGPAPLDAILDAHTIAPFDDCGGHVNTHVGYHYHAVTDCLDDAPASGTDQSAQIGIAMDGYPILANLNPDGSAPKGLDSCNGHMQDGEYHYHAGAAGSNAILGCLKAQAGCVMEGDSGVCDASKRRPRP